MSINDRIDAAVFAVVAWTTRRMAGVPNDSLSRVCAGDARAADAEALGSAEAHKPAPKEQR